jgi:spore maturation protein SpmB
LQPNVSHDIVDGYESLFMNIPYQLYDFFKHVFRRTGKACWILFKLMIPVSIIIRIIQQTGLLPYISDVLTPVMRIVGLPAQTAIVWLTAMVVNIYGGLLSLFSIYSSLNEPLTVCQMTVLLTMILIAHTFPIELGIAQKTGIRIIVMFMIRFGLGILAGVILSRIYILFHLLQEPVQLTPIFTTTETSWIAWGINELKNYGIIIAVIFLLVVFIHLLQVTGVLKIVNKTMEPVLKWLGISNTMLPLTVVGLTLGIAYGGGLLVEEGKQKGLKAKEIFYSMTLMGLFHSIFEDTILMLSMGGHWSGVIVFRTLFAFVCTYLIVRYTGKINERRFLRLFMTKSYTKQYIQIKTVKSTST